MTYSSDSSFSLSITANIALKSLDMLRLEHLMPITRASVTTVTIASLTSHFLSSKVSVIGASERYVTRLDVFGLFFGHHERCEFEQEFLINGNPRQLVIVQV